MAKLSPILADDLNSIVNSNISFEAMKNSSILVTGATGLVGSMLVKALLHMNESLDLHLSVLAFVRDKEKAKVVFDTFLHDEHLILIVGDVLEDNLSINQKVDYIIHTAAVTTSKFMIEKPVETINTAIRGTDFILRYAAKCKTKSVVYISSMEVYGSFDPNMSIVKEDMMGYINPLALRSNYPESKRMCENLLVNLLITRSINQ